MANDHGGYRRPSNPAPVSGPGALSKRTDGRQPVRDLPNAKYGEGQAYQQAEQAAPMAETPGGNAAPPQGLPSGPDLSGLVPLDAPSQNPDEDVLAGAAPPLPESAGPGGARIPMTPERAARLRSYLPVLVMLASQPDADPNTRQFVRKLRAEIG